MLRLIFAGAVLGGGAIATMSSGDPSVGAGVAFACAVGATIGGIIGTGLSYAGAALFQKEPDNYIIFTGVGAAIAGAVLAGTMGYNSMMETDSQTQNVTPPSQNVPHTRKHRSSIAYDIS